jgi:hypothetical protein
MTANAWIEIYIYIYIYIYTRDCKEIKYWFLVKKIISVVKFITLVKNNTGFLAF